MKKYKSIFRLMMIVALAGLLFQFSPFSSAMAKTSAAQMIPANFSDLAANARPGVVNIRTVKIIKGGGRVFRHFYGKPFGNQRNPFEDFLGNQFGFAPKKDYKKSSLGSGFIIDTKGFIVTNNHVIEGADQIKVKLAKGKEYDAKVIGRDPKTDLALIKIEGNEKFEALTMGDSDKLQVGRWVVAIGSPFGLEQTVTAGIVSAKGRILGYGPYEDFIQTDASINPGNSGGPLLNMQGQVVGINTAIIASGQGIGFAIPVNIAKGIIEQLKNSGEVTRGWLGVGIQDLTEELADYYGIKGQKGVLVTQIFEGDPAKKAGIQPNDVIIEIDGQSVSTGRELSGIIANTLVGKKTKIILLRNGEKRTVMVKLTKRSDDEMVAGKKDQTNSRLGVSVTDLTQEIIRQFGLEDNETGVFVTEVDSQSKGDRAGIQAGDIIKEVNRKIIKNQRDYTQQLKKTKISDSIMFLIKRRNAGILAVKILP